MIGVGEDDAGVKIAGEVALGDAFDGGLGADGHEDRRLDDAVVGVEESGASASGGALGLYFKVHWIL